MARTEVDARRELHNGTNNAGDIIFWNGLNFVLFKIWRLPILRKQKYAEKLFCSSRHFSGLAAAAGVARKPSLEGRIGGGPSLESRAMRAESPSSQGAPALPPRPKDHPPVQRQYSPPQTEGRVPPGGDMGPPPPPKGGNQAPPPTPPRGTTPPPPIPPHNASGAVGGVGTNPSNLPMFKRMSPVPSLPCRPGQGISQYPVMPPVTRGTSPTARPVIVPNSLEAQAQVDQMRMHALSLYPSTELNGAVVEPPPPYLMGTAAHSSAPPPPSYSQSLAMRQSPTHSSTSSDYRRSAGLPFSLLLLCFLF